MYEPVYGNYIGIVINDQDPEHRGRLQIFIPHISNTLYEDWNKKVAEENVEDISFKTFETGIFSESMKEKLKNVLPWAEAAIPIFGGGTSAFVSEDTGVASTYPESGIDESEVVYDDAEPLPELSPPTENDPNTGTTPEDLPMFDETAQQ